MFHRLDCDSKFVISLPDSVFDPGPNDDRLGPRFPEMTSVYDRELREIFQETVSGMELKPRPRVREGVASLVSGPAYLTPAECHVMKTLGTDVVGMSGAHENVVATHNGMKVGSRKKQTVGRVDDSAGMGARRDWARFVVHSLSWWTDRFHCGGKRTSWRINHYSSNSAFEGIIRD